MANFRCLIAGAATLLALAGPATCRAADRLIPVLAQGGVTVTKGGGRGYIVESLVTAALVGLALWVICKSSRRV